MDFFLFFFQFLNCNHHEIFRNITKGDFLTNKNLIIKGFELATL